MEPRSLKYVTASCEGDQLNGAPDTQVRRVCTDSRQAQPGDLFFALMGERFDGHNFLGEVASKQVSAVVVNRTKAPAGQLNCAMIGVENTRQALGRLAGRYRDDFKIPLIVVGGSNGKTTTKELIASVLRQKLATLWSEASFNNDVGVPLTLLNLERRHAAAVLEAGTNHPGELAPLVRLSQPQYGVLTNIGREHLEFFGDVDGVAQEEGWLAELLPSSGKLFIDGDNEWTPAIVKRTRAGVVRVGFGEHNEWRADYAFLDESGMTFQMLSSRSEFNGEYRINLLGRHQVLNALFAIAVGAELGLTPEEVRAGLAACRPSKMRLQIREAKGIRILDDSYNANADSMLAALQILHDLPCAGRRVAVLGDMAELGGSSAAAHREVGRCAAELGVNRFIAVGQWAHTMAQEAYAAGLKDVIEFADVPSVVAVIMNLVQPGDVVLLKASRATGLESVGEALRGNV